MSVRNVPCKVIEQIEYIEAHAPCITLYFVRNGHALEQNTVIANGGNLKVLSNIMILTPRLCITIYLVVKRKTRF